MSVADEAAVYLAEDNLHDATAGAGAAWDELANAAIGVALEGRGDRERIRWARARVEVAEHRAREEVAAALALLELEGA